MTLTKTQRVQLRAACETVESYLRAMGSEVQVTVTPTLVEVADTSWSGSSVDKTLYAAMKDALSSLQ